MHRPLYWLLPLVLGLVLAPVVGPAATVAGPNTQVSSQVRVINAIVGVPAAKLMVDGVPTEPPIMFGADPQYREIPPGPHMLGLTAPTPLGALPPPPLVSTELTFAPGGSYTIFAMGTATATTPTFLALADEPLGAAGGRGGIRFVNASPDTSVVDVAVAGGPVVASGIAYGQASPYILLPPGSYDLEVRVAGTTTGVLSFPAVELTPGGASTFAAVGLTSGLPPLAVITMTDL